MLKTSASDELKDAAWRELIAKARTGDPVWVVGCVGVAMPGLKNTAARVIRSSPSRLIDDIVSELLTEFVAQLPRIDAERSHIAARLLLWAHKGALRARVPAGHPAAPRLPPWSGAAYGTRRPRRCPARASAAPPCTGRP